MEKKLNEQQELPAPIPGTLDVFIIDGRLAQAYTNAGRSVVFLDEVPTGGKINKDHDINFNEYNYERGFGTVGDLREKGGISKKEYMAVHWGPEEKESPYVRDGVKFFGKFTKKK